MRIKYVITVDETLNIEPEECRSCVTAGSHRLFSSRFKYSGVLGHVYWYKQIQSSGTALPWRWGRYNPSKCHYMLATRNFSPIDTTEHARRSKTRIFDVQLPPRIVILVDSSIFSNKRLAFSHHLWSHAPPTTPARSPNRIPNTFCTAPFRITSLQPSREPLFHFLKTTQHEKYRLNSKNHM
jgi:hypothetical protein